MKTLIAIPARLQSTRLPNKALKDFFGKPMIVRVAERALESRLGDVLVVTDSDLIHREILKHLKNKVEVLTVDGPEIHCGTDRIVKALSIFDSQHFYDIIVNLQGDQPVMKKEYIKDCAKIIYEFEYKVGTLVAKVDDKKRKNISSVVKTIVVKDGKGIHKSIYFSRSPIPYGCSWFYHHLGIYSYKREILDIKNWKKFSTKRKELEENENLEGLRFIENNIEIGTKIVNEDIISVDIEDDYKKAKELFFKQFVHDKQS